MSYMLKHKTVSYDGKQHLPALNALKFILACMVVGIHIPFYGKDYILDFFRIAVPLFFMISGYFLPNAHGIINYHRIIRITKKILYLILIYNVIYLFWKYIKTGYLGFSVIVLLVDGGGICEPLWYLIAYLWSLFVLYILVRLHCEKLIFWLIPLGLAANLILGSYSCFIFDSQPVFITLSWLNRNFLSIGLPCIAIGIGIRRHEGIFVKSRYLILFTIIMTVTLVIERFCILRQTPYYVTGDILMSTVPLSAAVLILFLRNPESEFRMSQIGQIHSENIYLLHILVFSILSVAFECLAFSISLKIYLIYPMTLFVTCIISFLKEKVKLMINHEAY